VVSEIMPAPSIGNNGPGEWFEVIATNNVDLNGLEAATLPNGALPQTPSLSAWEIAARLVPKTLFVREAGSIRDSASHALPRGCDSNA
jgi:hypothetical protein